MLQQCSKKYIIVLKSSKLNILRQLFCKNAVSHVCRKSKAFFVVVAQMSHKFHVVFKVF